MRAIGIFSKLGAKNRRSSTVMLTHGKLTGGDTPLFMSDSVLVTTVRTCDSNVSNCSLNLAPIAKFDIGCNTDAPACPLSSI